ncbi:hypothetical protein [Porphyromonas sp.]|nr:hypothetical protein [Porphyromonas sp.]MDO4771386.1 hypothetical protein [Porphyromonas sp.]
MKTHVEIFSESVRGVLDFQVHGGNYVEVAFRWRFSHEANKKKKRG